MCCESWYVRNGPLLQKHKMEISTSKIKEKIYNGNYSNENTIKIAINQWKFDLGLPIKNMFKSFHPTNLLLPQFTSLNGILEPKFMKEACPPKWYSPFMNILW